MPQIREKAQTIKESFLPDSIPTIELLLDQIEQEALQFPTILQEEEFIEQVESLEDWLDEEDFIAVMLSNDKL